VAAAERPEARQSEIRADEGASFERRRPRRPIDVTPTAAGASTPNPKSL
jgi:hypothetical protein